MLNKSPETKRALFVLLPLFILILIAVGWTPAHKTYDYFATLIFPEKVTPENLTVKFKAGEKIKVLIAPGHDNDSWGAGFTGIKEADLNLEAGERLFNYLKQDFRFEVFITRDKNGYVSNFEKYFKEESSLILEFRNFWQNLFRTAIWTGLVEPKEKEYHGTASDEASLKLYGINKWANENNIDIVLHLHFNDYPGRRFNKEGIYSGFSIYVPEKQLPNSRASLAIAGPVSAQLNKYFSSSDLPQEKATIIEDQELIATGSNASLSSASLVIEYGYIYQKEFISPSLRPLVLKELAFQTYSGIKKYFEPESRISNFKTSLLPYKWSRPLSLKERSVDVLALQAVLTNENLYNCHLSGYFGNCTEAATREFQEKYGIEPIGVVGPQTLKKLNEIYGVD